MAFTRSFVLVFVSLALFAVQLHSVEARTIRGAPLAAAAVASSARSSIGHRKLFAAQSTAVRMAKASEAALPADVYVLASPCPAAAGTPGSTASAVFTVGASLNAQVFKQVALQVDFPRALYPTVSLTCLTSAAQAIACDAPAVTAADLKKYDIASTACMLGDLAVTGPVTCTLSYTVPATPLPAAAAARQILGAVTYAPLDANVVEDSLNNAATTCALSP